MTLLKKRDNYKPFAYPWAYDAYKMQSRLHWLPEEVPLQEDVKDWATKLSASEKHLLTHIFRFFTQADVEVSNNYNTRLSQVFLPPEIQMMLSTFASFEAIHVDAYSLLIDTIGIPESEYSAFLTYKEMKDKHDYFATFSVENPKEMAKTLAAFGGFVEGVQLFASFAILLNFTRFNKMKGMGQIITWSIRDEELHTQSIIKLFRTFVRENRSIWNDELKAEIYEIAENMVRHEDAFIDLAFELGGIEGLTSDEVKQYIRYIAGRRLIQMGMKNIFKVKKNPLEWIEWMIGVELTNFFENRSTEYSKASTRGTWDEAFEEENK